MKLILSIKKLLKNIINTNNLVLVLNVLKITNDSYFLLIAFLILIIGLFLFAITVLFPSVIIPVPYIVYVTKLVLPIIFFVVYSINILMIVYTFYSKHNNMPKRVLKYSTIKGVSKFSSFFSNIVEYYYPLLPICMITTGIALATLFICNEIFLLLGVTLFILGFLVYFFLINLKATFYNLGTYDRYNNITRANDILTNYISPKETNIEYLAIKEFTKHFLRVLDGIDFYFEAVFDKGINIDCLQNNENITVKQLIKRYLPIYLSYCSEAELNLFKMKINSMVNLIDNKNMIVSLDIIKIVHSIHQDIVKFLNQHSYVVPKSTLVSSLISKANKKHTTIMDIFLSIFVITGFFKFFIPSEIQNEIFDTLNGIINNLSGHDKYIALILPFLASIPVLYKFLKELFE